ncbi:MAG: acetylornithine deacetylase/succinyl-diaminopimelate desuccinylase-like protein [Natronomonas sp.]|jgi:acetylornithine deacetylase/succinyl-diaminopimelate desuccinylase-like protein
MGDIPAPDPSLADDPVSLLQGLVRFDTTNPPGDERACVEWTERLLDAAGFETDTYASDPDRPNLVARLPGDGPASPLLLYGHVDVVPTEGQDWTHPPFAGVIEDGFVWGRGTLDMKGGVAMLLAAALRAARGEGTLAGDLMMMVVSDEEAGGEAGAAYMVEQHPELFADIEYAIGEFGGFPMTIAGDRFYPVQLDEKAICWSQLTFSGPAGHGSTPGDGGAMADMARAVTALTGSRLPVHIVPPVEEMLEAIAAELDAETGALVRDLLDPGRTDEALATLDQEGGMVDALLHNTVAPTVVRGGDKENVIPGEVAVTLDCRLLSGQTATDLERELRATVPDDIAFEFETLRYEAFPAETDAGLFDLLAETLETADPEGTVVPFVLPGGTDGRHLSRVGVQSYGYTPLRLPEGFSFMNTIHAADERVPVDAVSFGADRLTEVVEGYAGATTTGGD